jgi:hypothetical protein
LIGVREGSASGLAGVTINVSSRGDMIVKESSNSLAEHRGLYSSVGHQGLCNVN